MAVLESTYSWQAPDGSTRFARSWRPEVSPRARIAVVHGYGEHSGRYAGFASALCGVGFEVHAFDWMGHGRSPGVAGELSSITRLVEDARAFTAALAQPRFLFGQSAGGAASLIAAAGMERLDGLVLSSPFLLDGTPVSEISKRVGGWLAPMFPRIPVKRLDQEALSRDATAVEAYRTDPLVYTGPIRLRTGRELLALADEAIAQAGVVEVPALLVHGTADRIADPDGTRRVFARLGSVDKRLELYPGGFHELLHDLDGARVTNDIVGWLSRRAYEATRI